MSEEKRYSISKFVNSDKCEYSYEELADILDVPVSDFYILLHEGVTPEQYEILMPLLYDIDEKSAESISERNPKNPPALYLYSEIREFFDDLTVEEAGVLIKGAINYFDNGIELETSNRTIKILFGTMKRKIDESKIEYAYKCYRNRKAIEKRWNNSK